MELDVEVVNRVGRTFADTATELSGAATQSAELRFAAARAGRDYSAEGEALCASMRHLTSALESWSEGARVFGESVHGATARIVDTDSENAANLGGVDQ